VPVFASKPAPAGDKVRGGYYTPEPIARFLATWAGGVNPAGPARLLEPSCGNGAILEHLASVPGARVDAVELIATEAATATTRTGVPVACSDFFQWFSEDRFGSYDAVAGNPPYIRFGTWDAGSRDAALELMRGQGLRPSRLTNAWVPFVVAALLAVRPGGRVALLVPAELLQVGYAAALRSYLVDRCARITVVTFSGLVFPGVLQEVVLLLAERGCGPARIRTVDIADAAALSSLDLDGGAAIRAPLHATEKWTKYFLDTEAIDLLRRLRADGPRSPLQPLAQYAEIDVGVVTGRNAFFCLTADAAERQGLTDAVSPLVSRSHQLHGTTFTPADLATHDITTARTRLLVLARHEQPTGPVAEYLEQGVAAGVPDGYKCRVRPVWWEVPGPWIPDGFMLRQISTAPRLVANLAGATSTDTVHRVRTGAGVAMPALAAAAYNSATFALAEVLGRSYGGGILELEPSECEALPVPDPALVPEDLAIKVDELVRQRRTEDALDLVDRLILVEKLGVDPTEIAVLRRAWTRLRDRRARRGARQS
jgi:adenine-specific DNA methylase